MARSLTARFAAGHGFSRPAGDGGFTLVETLVAFTVFMVVVGSASFWLVKTIQLTTRTRSSVVAANLAAQELEKIRSEHNTAEQLDSTAQTVVLQNTTFTVTPSLNPSLSGTCTTGSTRQVTVTVTWNGATKPVSYASVLAC